MELEPVSPEFGDSDHYTLYNEAKCTYVYFSLSISISLSLSLLYIYIVSISPRLDCYLDEVNFVMNHAPGAGLIAQPLDRQSSATLLYPGRPLQVPIPAWSMNL